MNAGPELKPLIAAAAGRHLSEAEAEEAFEIMMSGHATPAQIGGLLMALRVRGETVDEIAGAVRAMRAKMVRLKAPEGAIDTCGTGGDGAGTLNISTGASLVAAACGVPVAKHGNRAMSSKTGAADVLAALGVNLDADMRLIERSMAEAGMGFMLAPRHHAAMRHVGPVRVELGTRTIFNLMGPLSNPAGASRQLVGVFARSWTAPLATVLGRLGAERAWVVHGSDGLDEITTTGATYVAELRRGAVHEFEVTPEEAGLPRAAAADLKGADAKTNARALAEMLDGKKGPYRDIVLLNAAAALVVAGKAKELSAGAALAAEAIDSGRAKAVLARMVAITNEPSGSGAANA
jgi:anthranilate phosphoribosyltransferase